MDVYKILENSELFAGLDKEHLEQVCGLCNEVEYKANDVIFEEDSDGTELFVMPAGRIGVELTMHGGAFSEQIFQGRERQIFGELALIDAHRRSARVRALDDIVLLVITREDIFRLMEEEPKVGFKIMTNLSRILSAKLRENNIALRNSLMQQRHMFGVF